MQLQTGGNTILVFDKISLSLNGKKILNNFSFRIREGDKAALTGPSGIGKTTVLNLIMGFIKPDSGRIWVNETEVKPGGMQSIRKMISWLPQRLVIGNGTVRETITFLTNLEQNKETDFNMETIFNKLALDIDSLNQKISDLSEGQRQRIGLAICLKLNRPLMLLDEPTSALDADSKKRVIKTVIDESDNTVLAATHDRTWLEHCNKIITMEQP